VTHGEAREQIYRALGQMLSGTDFRLKRSEEGYVRAIRGCRQDIGVPFYDYNPRFEFSLVMGVRLDEVEKITFMFSGAPVQCRSGGVSTIIRLEYFAPEVPDRFTVWSEKDIEQAANVLAPIVRERIVPFLDQHRDVQSLDKALHHGAQQLDTSHHPYRGMSGITIARLAGNPEFDTLVAKYLAEMSSIPPDYRAKFVRLAEYLKTMS